MTQAHELAEKLGSILMHAKISTLLAKASRIGPREHGTERMILEYSLEFPTQQQKRVANKLNAKGINVSDGGVRSVWLRHDLDQEKPFKAP